MRDLRVLLARQSITTLITLGLALVFVVMFLFVNAREQFSLRGWAVSDDGISPPSNDDLDGPAPPIAQSSLGEAPGDTEEQDANVDAALPRFVLDDTNPTTIRPWRANAGVHLITSFFKGTYKKKRVDELFDCLRRNLRNPAFEAVHIMWEDVNPRLEFKDLTEEENNRLVTMKTLNQPTYSKFFTYSNVMLERGSIAIIANSDLYFDRSITALKFGAPGNQSNWRSAMALSRRHAPECGERNDWRGTYDLCEHYIGSHDAFVFAPPVPAWILKETKHTQNHFGAENIVVWAFLWSKNFKGHVTNPCQRVHAYHLHCVPERHYTVGSFISYGRHGNVAPGVPGYNAGIWNYIY
jgi:hypothetical protein